MSQNLSMTQSEDSGYLGYYEGTMRHLPPLMVGKIFLTPKYLGFHAFEIRASGLLEKSRLIPTGKVLGISVDKIVDVTVEEGVRSKKSRPNWKDGKDFERKAAGEKKINANARPLDSKEKYRQLMVTCETEQGLEVAMFEVADPQLLADKIRNFRSKTRI
ncbi:MAG: hypothetical protein LYZ66_07090 [Nitrososphaerales archaeon]|nr:hypothetical protein [Nitrososphaerales archaeon]